MRLRAALAVIGWAIAATAHAGASPATQAGPCPPRGGGPGKPLVPDAETAREIFVAVEKRFNPAADLKGFPVIEAEDEGKYWTVFRYNPPVEMPGALIVTAGGGQLEMRVAKCDGAMTHVHLSR
jgi:hypothetical protein